MKKALILTFALFLLPAFAFASPIVIKDTYIGADPTHNSWDGEDIVGSASYFDVSRMEVSFENEMLYVDIYTTYLNNIGKYQTQLGDLFISSDGWNPAGDASAGYLTDNAATGEAWEYALVMDTHLPSSSTLSGDVGLYAVSSGTVVNSYAPSGYVYREGQETQFSTDADALMTGTWSFHNIGGTDTDDYLRYALHLNDFQNVLGNADGFGLHWTFTCGNDVIEGYASSPVPEPATMFLLGSGLLGLGTLRRKQNRRS